MAQDNIIDKYLIRIKNGEQCFEEFFNLYSGRIKYVAYRYLVDKSLVGDVVLNTFCNILDGIHTFKGENGLAWMCKIAQNEAYRLNKRERKHDHVSLEDISDEVACVSDFTDDIGFMSVFDDILNDLGEPASKIVVMRLIEGLTYPQIAEKLNMYVGTVFKVYNRSIKEINKKLFK